jgi:hypothetical protein
MPIGCLWHFRLESIQRSMAFGRHLGAPGEYLRKHWWSKMGSVFLSSFGRKKDRSVPFSRDHKGTHSCMERKSANYMVLSYPSVVEGRCIHGRKHSSFPEHNLLSSLGKESGPFFA